MKRRPLKATPTTLLTGTYCDHLLYKKKLGWCSETIMVQIPIILIEIVVKKKPIFCQFGKNAVKCVFTPHWDTNQDIQMFYTNRRH